MKKPEMKRAVPFLALIFLAVSVRAGSGTDPFRDGDIIFQTSRSGQSAAIQKATHSKYSHLGMIFRQGGKLYVYEAIKTVQYTPLPKWIARGEGGRYVVKRLGDAGAILTPEAVAELRKTAERFRGRPYDYTFEWSDDRLYCSELVWKIYERALGVRIGRLQKLRDFDLSDAAVKAKMKARYGDRVPLDETVVSPGEMFASGILTTVAERCPARPAAPPVAFGPDD